MLPLAKVEAMMVIAKRLIWEIAKARVRGTIILVIWRIPGEEKSKIFFQRKPNWYAAGI